MNAVMRIFTVFFVVCLLALAVFGFREVSSRLELVSGIHRAEQVEPLRQARLRFLEGQNRAAEEWLTQRCTWEETLQRLQELDQEIDQAWPGYTRMIGETTQQSAQERHYQLILYYVTQTLRKRPEELTVSLCRLEKDSQRVVPDFLKPGNAPKDIRAREGATLPKPAGAPSSP
jgi:hypothetical protein